MDENGACDKLLRTLTYDPNYLYKEFKSRGSDGQSMCCIRSAPVEIRQLNPSAYTPKSLSIGHLPVETMPRPWIGSRDKINYTRFLLERSINEDADAQTPSPQFAETVKNCFRAVMESEVKARDYYPKEVVHPTFSAEEVYRILLEKESSSSSAVKRKPMDNYLYSPKDVSDVLKSSEWIDGKKKYSPESVELLLKKNAETEKSKHREETGGGAGPTYGAEEVRAVLEKEAFPEFALTLMLDGCFIIEILYRHYKNQPYDAILMDEQRKNKVRNDLILLENQIPFFVLQILFNLTLGIIPEHKNHPLSLTECVLSFFGNTMGLEMECSRNIQKHHPREEQPPYHILHLLHMHHLHSQPPTRNNPSQSLELQIDTSCCLSTCTITPSRSGDAKSDHLVFKSATQLKSKGLKLQKGRTGHMFDVKFTTPCLLSRFGRRCGLQIPSFIVDDFTETFLRNMIAFEQCCPSIERYFTSHAFLMDQLINSAEDVKLLEEAGIIRINYLGCPKKLDALFNNICENVHLGKHGSIFQTQCAQVNKYCDRSWPTRRQTLRRDYFSSPWSVISVFAALLLFHLTSLQTIYTMLSYYSTKN